MNFRQPQPHRFGIARLRFLGRVHHVFDRKREDHAVDRLVRTAFLQEVKEAVPACLIRALVTVLRRVTPRRVDQDCVFGKPPVAIARAAKPLNHPAIIVGQREFDAGIFQRRRLARTGGPDDHIPWQIIQKRLAARFFQRRQCRRHLFRQHFAIADGFGHQHRFQLCRLFAPSAPFEQPDDQENRHDPADH